MCGIASAVSTSQCARASWVDAMKPTDSSSGVVCALPTTKSPAWSTMNVSVMVPPASMASTLGSLAMGPSLLAQRATCAQTIPR